MSTDSENKKFQIKSERIDEIKRDKITFFFIFIILVFILELIFKKPLNYFTLLILKNLNYDGRFCYFLEKILVIHSSFLKIFVLIIIVNFKSIFVGLVFVLITESLTIFNGILKLIYIEPRPFWEIDIVPCNCKVSYGNPSIVSSDITMIFLLIYKIFGKNKSSKIMIIILSTISILVILSAEFLENINSLNQLILGICLSYAYYYLYFELFELNMESLSIFKSIIVKQYIFRFICYMIGIYVIVNLFHFSYDISVNHKEKISEIWFSNIIKRCTYIPFLFYDSLSNRSSIFLPISIFVSLYVEYTFVFSKNYAKYICYNADNKLNIKWNDTSIIKSFIRSILTLSFVFLNNYIFFVGDVKDDSFIKLIFFRYIVLNTSIGIFIFLIGKLMFKYLFLTNESIQKRDNFFFLNYDSLYININNIDELESENNDF